MQKVMYSPVCIYLYTWDHTRTFVRLDVNTATRVPVDFSACNMRASDMYGVRVCVWVKMKFSRPKRVERNKMCNYAGGCHGIVSALLLIASLRTCTLARV